jgi:hypothetical protein
MLSLPVMVIDLRSGSDALPGSFVHILDRQEYPQRSFQLTQYTPQLAACCVAVMAVGDKTCSLHPVFDALRQEPRQLASGKLALTEQVVASVR